MIDTLHLRLDNPTIRLDHRLLQLTTQTGDGELAGTGYALHFVDGTIGHVSKVNYRDGQIHVYSSNGYLYVACSLARLQAGGADNIQPVTMAQAEQLFGQLQHCLEGLGILVDIREAVVARLDIFSNAATQYPYETFLPFLETLTVPRRVRKTYPGTHNFESQRRTDTIYNKRKQHQDTGLPPTGLPQNLIRFETRFLRVDAVRNQLGVKTVAGLLRSWPRIRRYYLAHIRKVLRVDVATPGSAASPDELSALLENPRCLARALFARHVFQQMGSVDQLSDMLRGRGLNRKKVYRMVKRVVRDLDYGLPGPGPSFNELKTELYNKLVEGLGGEPV